MPSEPQEQACCACRTIRYDTVDSGDGTVRDEWRCHHCGCEFVRRHPEREGGPSPVEAETAEARVDRLLQMWADSHVDGSEPLEAATSKMQAANTRADMIRVVQEAEKAAGWRWMSWATKKVEEARQASPPAPEGGAEDEDLLARADAADIRARKFQSQYDQERAARGRWQVAAESTGREVVALRAQLAALQEKCERQPTIEDMGAEKLAAAERELQHSEKVSQDLEAERDALLVAGELAQRTGAAAHAKGKREGWEECREAAALCEFVEVEIDNLPQCKRAAWAVLDAKEEAIRLLEPPVEREEIEGVSAIGSGPAVRRDEEGAVTSSTATPGECEGAGPRTSDGSADGHLGEYLRYLAAAAYPRAAPLESPAGYGAVSFDFDALFIDEPPEGPATTYEYRTTSGQRKCWDGEPDLSKEGWEEYEPWERFDYHEERYWRRPTPPPETCEVCGWPKGTGQTDDEYSPCPSCSGSAAENTCDHTKAGTYKRNPDGSLKCPACGEVAHPGSAATEGDDA